MGRAARKDPIPRRLVMPKEKAARKIARAIRLRRRERILTVHGHLGVWICQHAPWLVRAVLRLGAAWG